MSPFQDVSVSRKDLLSLGREAVSGEPYLSIPVTNRMTEYEEYYRLTPDEFALFQADPRAARAFADACRARRHDDRLILEPGSDCGEPT